MSEIQHNSPPALAGGAGGGSSSAAKEERALARSLHPQPLPEVREGRLFQLPTFSAFSPFFTSMSCTLSCPAR